MEEVVEDKEDYHKPKTPSEILHVVLSLTDYLPKWEKIHGFKVAVSLIFNRNFTKHRRI